MSGVRRDCVCLRAQHQHGTRDAYNRDECRCTPCTADNARRQRQYDRRRAHLTWQGKTMWTTPIGTQRRLQALAADGWPLPVIAGRLDRTAEAVSQIRKTTQRRILAATADTFTALFEQLWPLNPPPSQGSTYARNHAERQGWAASWRWEGVDIDDPDAEPLPQPDTTIDEVKVQRACDGQPVVLNHAEKLAAVWTLHARGLDDSEIAWRLQMTAAGVFKIRDRHFPHTVRRREAAA